MARFGKGENLGGVQDSSWFFYAAGFNPLYLGDWILEFPLGDCILEFEN